MTVPIYYGCCNLESFFNIDGVIVIKKPTVECVMEALKGISVSDYKARIPAMIENYEKVKKYICNEDYLTDNYMPLFSTNNEMSHELVI